MVKKLLTAYLTKGKFVLLLATLSVWTVGLAPAFANGKSAAAGPGYLGGADIVSSVLASDGTPSALHYSMEGLAAETQYFVKVRINTGTSYFGYTWNPATKKWLRQQDAWLSHPVTTTDTQGKAAGWLHIMNSGADPGAYSLQIVARQVDGTTNLLPSLEPEVQIVDMNGDAGWIEGHAYGTGGTPAERMMVKITDADANIVALYSTEANGVDEGYSDEAGYFRVAAPAANSLTATLNDPITLTLVGSPTTGIQVTAGSTTYADINKGTHSDTEGPVTTSLAISPDNVTVSDQVTLDAVIDDASAGNSGLVAAEYFIDVDPGEGLGQPLAAADGSFDTPLEEVTATMTTVPQPGRYMIHVRGEDSHGNWGEARSMMLSVWTCIFRDPQRSNEFRINADAEEIELFLAASDRVLADIASSFLVNDARFKISHGNETQTLTAVGDIDDDAAVVWVEDNQSQARRVLVYDPRGFE